MGFKDKKIQYYGGSLKNPIFRGGSRKNNKRDCLKRAGGEGGRGAVTVFKFKRGLGKKEGGVFDGG